MNRKGQALVEFVLILPIFIMILFSIVDFGMIFNKKNELENISIDIMNLLNNNNKIEEIQKEYHTFSNYIWHFTENKIIYEVDKTSSELSDTISKDLKKRGMKFVGTTIIYSYLQAIGVIYSHEMECYLKIKK